MSRNRAGADGALILMITWRELGAPRLPLRSSYGLSLIHDLVPGRPRTA
jgi:hypothetical protein